MVTFILYVPQIQKGKAHFSKFSLTNSRDILTTSGKEEPEFRRDILEK
jgi:hypothetical protein